MKLEIIVLSEVGLKEEIYDITYIWNLRNDTNEQIYKTETDSKTQKTNFYDYKKGKGSEGQTEK